MDWSLKISKATNGYILEWEDECEDESVIKYREVIEDSDDELHASDELLWWVMEYFGFGGSRYDKERLVIRREPGDKYVEVKEEE